MSELQGNYTVYTAPDLAGAVLRLLENQAAFYASDRGSIRRNELLKACKKQEKDLHLLASSLVSRGGDLGTLALSVKLMLEAQKDYFSYISISGARASEKHALLRKSKELESAVRQSANSIIAKLTYPVEAQPCKPEPWF